MASNNHSFMLLVEPFEARMLLESLLRFRKDLPVEWSERDVDKMMFEIASHAGIEWTKVTVPEAYEICFPEGPPKIE